MHATAKQYFICSLPVRNKTNASYYCELLLRTIFSTDASFATTLRCYASSDQEHKNKKSLLSNHRRCTHLQDLELQGLAAEIWHVARYTFGLIGHPTDPQRQPILLELLGAQKLGIAMSDEFQLHPEQSTSAIVCHHPSAKYFTI